ncbi:uncharacterized protein LOC131309421 [Rhododendron vialii]|uniref:uncharacterized protein LOC131309421 n=1 Tax=Rhododendron vialii TaxID=182163 RepID=UPI00265FDDA5|nr:uncharacterized protein LOC131309421 [Rhododendron vialii]
MSQKSGKRPVDLNDPPRRPHTSSNREYSFQSRHDSERHDGRHSANSGSRHRTESRGNRSEHDNTIILYDQFTGLPTVYQPIDPALQPRNAPLTSLREAHAHLTLAAPRPREKEEHRRHQRREKRKTPERHTNVPPPIAPQIAAEGQAEDNSKLGKAKASPFVDAIQQERPPDRFVMPKLKRYEAKEDAVAFVCRFRQTMSLHNFSDALMCKIFPLTLSEPIMLWYNQLKPKSISCFNELELEFSKRFVTSNIQPKTLSMLVNMRRTAGETLRLYTERYWEVYNLIPDCDQGVAAESFMNGLDPTSAMFRDVSRNPPKTMGELMTIIEKDCVHEEAMAERHTSKAEPAKTIGPKKQWIDVRQNPLPPPPPLVGNLVSVIQGLVSEGRAAELRSEIDRAVASTSVCNVGASGKRKWEDPSFGGTITFSSDDLKGVQLPHADALVVTIAIEKSTVQRVLIDQGSSADVMFFSTYQSLGLSPAQLRTASAPLVSFMGAPVWPLGLTTLPVRAGSRILEIEFVVVASPSPYNVILGRTWLHEMQAVASTYHQVVKFVGWNGRQESLRGDQIQSKKCYISTVTNKQSCMEVQCVAAAPIPVIEDVGVLAEQRSAEELIRFSIPGEEGRYFLIGSSLSMDEREEMYQFLMRNIEVFAWTPQDMSGVDPSFAMHSLNVDPNRRPVVQKVRRSSAAHTEAVIAEVNQLLEAGVIREVLYPTWLANPVVVPKKNGKLRVCVDYTNLNDACPMDRFPLPRIEQMVDATAGCERLSFRDAYRGYHQIALDPEDQEKMAFISPRGTFCYKVVPFGLKNAGATFQRSITKMFPGMLGVKVEAYIDDLVCRSMFARDHLRDLGEVFAVLKHRKLRLNAEKCAFGVSSGKFLGYMVSRRGIEADPTQILAVQRLRAPRTIKEVQRLTGMVAALNRFIRRSSDLCRPFFRAITTSRRRFVWIEECEQALQSLKRYLSHAPLLVKPLPDEDLYLYLAISDHATSAVLVRREGMDHQPIFYSTVLWKTDTSSRILKFSQDLANFDIQFEPRTAIKGQVLADFFAELTPGLQDEANALATTADEARIQEEEVLEGPSVCQTEPLRARYSFGRKKPKRQWKLFSGDAWRLTVDGASNVHGAGAGIVLVSPSGTVHESVVSIGYTATNNEAEYEALIAGLQLALRLDADSVHVFCDSQLIVGHLNDDYQAKDQRMNAYVSHVLALFGRFGRVEVEWIAREHNAHADALAGLASVYKTSGSRTITFDEVPKPSFEKPSEQVMAIALGPSQLDSVVAYLKNQVLPTNKREAYKIRCRAANFFLGPNDNLYRRTFTGPDLHVVHDDLVPAVLEELHSGSCGAHSGGRSLAQRALTQGYWWPKMVKQSEEYVKLCVRCQKQASLIHQPAFPLKMITNLFTKWVEASPMIKTTAGDVERFIWKHIISRFGVPYAILSDNGSQFVASALKAFYAKRHITIQNSSVAYPQGNGQAEASNKTITRGLKRRLDRKLGKWVEELPHVLWAYRTTPRRSTGRTPFAMAYGMEAVLPLSTMIPTVRTENFNPIDNSALVGTELDLAKELRDNANLRHAAYQQEVARGYNRNVRARPFNVGDLVLRMVTEATKLTKLKDPYEGPYRVVEKIGHGVYKLAEMDGTPIANPWNAQKLRKFHG